jgi:hypothetical protein
MTEICDHDSASGTGEPNTWRCDSCAATWREVDDPEGTFTRYVRNSPVPVRFRIESIPSTERGTS